MPIVEVNGQELEFPDDMQPDAIKQVLQTKFPAASTKEQGLIGNITSDVQKRVEQARQTQADYAAGKQSLPTTIFQQLGNAGAGTITDVGLDVLGSAYKNITPEFIQKDISKVGGLAAKGAKAIGGAIIDSPVGDLLQSGAKYVQENPQQMRTASAAMNLVGMVPAAPIAGALATAAPKAMKGAAASLPTIGSASGDILAPVNKARAAFEARKVPAYNPIEGMQKMAEKYAANKQVANELYAARDAVAAGKPIDSTGLANGVRGLVADIKSDPFHEARGALPRLEQLAGKLDSVGADTTYLAGSGTKFDLADAAELKTIMNEAFNPSRWTQNAKGTVYGNLGRQVDAILKGAAQKYPEFGKAQELANKFWLNNVQNAFQDNAVLAKYFKPDDLREFQSLAEGRTVALHPETVKRANATIKNIKTAEDLDALRLVLPPEMAQQLSREVVKKLGSSGRLQAAGKAAMGAFDLRPHGIARTVGNVADVIGGVQKTPEQLALIKAAKSAPPRMYSPAELAKMSPAQAKAARNLMMKGAK